MQSADDNDDECETPFQTTVVAPTAPRRELRTKLFPSDNHKLSDDDHREILEHNEKQKFNGHEEDHHEKMHSHHEEDDEELQHDKHNEKTLLSIHEEDYYELQHDKHNEKTLRLAPVDLNAR